MDAFSPIINLLVLLTALSLGAERLAQVGKLRHRRLQKRLESDLEQVAGEPEADAEKVKAARDKVEKWRADGEDRVTIRGIFWGVIVAFAVKANLFTIMAQLEDPWTTLGWVQEVKGVWVRAPELRAAAGWGQALVGCVATGLCLGFGSNFWHDILKTVYAVKQRKKLALEVGSGAAGAQAGGQTHAGS